MARAWLRIWKRLDLDEIQETLLLVGELTADCGKCQQLGLEWKSVTTCPSCGATFRYAASRSGTAAQARRVSETRQDLKVIELIDIKQIQGKTRASDLFGGS